MGLRGKDEKRLERKGASQAALDLQNQGEMSDFRGERGQKRARFTGFDSLQRLRP